MYFARKELPVLRKSRETRRGKDSASSLFSKCTLYSFSSKGCVSTEVANHLSQSKGAFTIPLKVLWNPDGYM